MLHFVEICLLLFLVEQFSVVNCVSTILENVNRRDAADFTTAESRTIDSQNFEFDPLGLNFEPERPEDQTEFLKRSEEWQLDPPIFRWSKKSPELRREAESIPRMLTTSYKNTFDKKYSQRYNYSKIFEDSRREETLLKSGARSFPQSAGNYSFSSFPSLNEIYEYLAVLEKMSEGRAVVVPLEQHNGSWHNVHTRLGNEILSIRISSERAVAHERNPINVVVAGIHGGDWYAVQSAIFVSTELVLNVNRTRRHDSDWWIIPILNPDGYEISHAGSEWRDWEKNFHGLGDTNSSKCFGVDLDLNFEYQWLECDYSLCDFNFPGTTPFAVPETRGLRDTLEAFGDYCDSFVALKEGRQLLVFPFSDTLESPRYVESIDEISKKAVEAFLEHVEGNYEFGQSSHLLDFRAGFIEDWAKVHLGVEKSFAFYLGPTEKDRRELLSQHLEDHMNGTFELLQVIAAGKIDRKSSRNSSYRNNPPLIYIALISLILCIKQINR